MKTLMLLGLVLLCGQFSLSLAQEEEQGSKVISEVAASMQNSLKNAVEDLSKLDLIKELENTPVIGDVLKTTKIIVGNIVSFNINHAQLLKISLQENQDTESLSLSVPLDVSLSLNTRLFKTIDVSLNAKTSLELTTEKDEDGGAHLVVSKCQTSPQLLEISAKRTGLFGLGVEVSETVSNLAQLTVNQLACPLITTAVKLVPPALVDSLQNVVRGNVSVTV
ncbi:BPI fold-containing family A member 1-like [Phascolarctos cinereus]|uniref:BPI fold-containing family A member 1 n=1 Tax=Phascolarctos cinereus TaxID=38626 RepID=A0A6P5KKM1_PHACI|nr:uncharacterized protein LOC110211321 [Phascolarctos cinereus]XP_020846211.1 uncharacterized protein LOC110211325 [Phascolarctos cinereus]